MNAGVTQLARVRGYYPLSRGFESRPRHHLLDLAARCANTEQPQPGRPVKDTPDYTLDG